jgi:hypothetical protein
LVGVGKNGIHLLVLLHIRRKLAWQSNMHVLQNGWKFCTWNSKGDYWESAHRLSNKNSMTTLTKGWFHQRQLNRQLRNQRLTFYQLNRQLCSMLCTNEIDH